MKVLSLWKGELLAPPRTMAAIAEDVADRHGISVADLKGRGRHRPVVLARHEAMWLMAREVKPDGRPRWSNAKIGQWFDRDHTTVVHARRAHAERCGLDRGWRVAA